jgi:hypothetical protein
MFGDPAVLFGRSPDSRMSLSPNFTPILSILLSPSFHSIIGNPHLSVWVVDNRSRAVSLQNGYTTSNPSMVLSLTHTWADTWNPNGCIIPILPKPYICTHPT